MTSKVIEGHKSLSILHISLKVSNYLKGHKINLFFAEDLLSFDLRFHG